MRNSIDISNRVRYNLIAQRVKLVYANLCH